MRVRPVVAAGAALLLAAASTASAEVQLSLRNGRVTVVATNATVRQILTEWARVGDTKIVNVERIPGGPVTLELTDMPEQEALDLLLRSVTGYLAAPRPLVVEHLSRYDRILVLPTPAVARVPVTAAPAPAPTFQQPLFPQPPGDDGIDEGPSVQPARGPLFPTQPRVVTEDPGGSPFGGATSAPGAVAPQVTSPGTVVVSPAGQPFFVSPPGASPVGTPRPGMVLQPPPQPNVIEVQQIPPEPTEPD